MANRVHPLNPWISIQGRQRTRIETLHFVKINKQNTPPMTPQFIREIYVPLGKEIQDIANEQTMLGHLIGFDMANYIENASEPILPSQIEIQYQTAYYTNLGAYVNHASGQVSCSDSLFNGDCRINPGHLFIGWNLRSKQGRLVGSGAYIATLNFKVLAKGKVIAKSESTETWGVMRLLQ
jgi:hypothetical protein